MDTTAIVIGFVVLSAALIISSDDPKRKNANKRMTIGLD